MKAIFLVICAAWFVFGCTSSVRLVNPLGDRAEVFMRDYSFVAYDVELLALTDSSLIVECRGRLSQIALSKLSSVQVQGYNTPVLSKTLSLFTPVLFEVIIFSAANSVHQNGWVVASVFAMVATVWLMYTGDPKSHFGMPLKPGETESLRLYCRYPQGLTPAQCRSLLDGHGQNDFLAIDSRTGTR